MRRRRNRASLAGLVLLLTIPLPACTRPPQQADPVAAPAPAVRPHDALSMQFIAHPDDDILFMNPDLANWIEAGMPTVSVYLTSGESDLERGVYYAADRQQGTRAAYAEMAGVDNDWTVHEVKLDARHSAELYRLRARPQIQLVWLNLPDDNNPRADGGRHALTRLWTDRSGQTSVRTLVPPSGGVPQQYEYSHGDLVAALAALLDRFDPTVIRSQDPAPDARYRQDWQKFHDHPDHVTTARFAREAAERYFATAPENRAVVTNYRDYNIADSPVNLAPSERARKRGHFAAYVPHDSEVSMAGSYAKWTERTYYRWPRGTAFATRDPHGTVHVYAVLGHRLLKWTRAPNDHWSGPVEVGRDTKPLRPTLTMTVPRGEATVLAQGGSPPRALRLREHEWTDLGSPSDAAAQTGAPTAVTDASGNLVVFARDASGGLSMRREGNGWVALGGSGIQGSPAAALDARGRIHVFASTADEVLHWSAPEPGGQPVPGPSPLPGIKPAGQPATVAGANGTPAVAVRVANTGEIAVSTQGGAEPAIVLGPPGGFGTPELVRAGGSLLLFARNADGGVSMAEPGTGAGWKELGGYVLDHPAAVVEPTGAIALLALGPAARLLVNRQVDGEFRGWQPAVHG